MVAITTRDESVAALRLALGTWADTAREAWSRACTALSATVVGAETELRRRAARVAQLEAALHHAHRAEVAALRRALADAETSLQLAERAVAELISVQRDLAAASRRAMTSLTDVVPAARADLLRRLGDLREYRGGIAGGAAAAYTSPAVGTAGPALASLGLQEVPVADIDFADNPITGAFGRGGATLVDYRWAVETWDQVVRPGVRRGMSRADFAARDEGRAAPPLRRSADVYDLFLGDQDRIVLSPRPDATFDVTNGRHRVAVARQLGIAHVPARVVT